MTDVGRLKMFENFQKLTEPFGGLKFLKISRTSRSIFQKKYLIIHCAKKLSYHLPRERREQRRFRFQI